MVLNINGVDFIDETNPDNSLVAYGGFKWQRNDIESPDAGRDLSGLMHRGRVSTKIRLDITCKPLTAEQAMLALQTIYPEFVTVTYTDPQDGLVTKTMYSNNNPATFLISKRGKEYWGGISFPLIEQ